MFCIISEPLPPTLVSVQTSNGLLYVQERGVALLLGARPSFYGYRVKGSGLVGWCTRLHLYFLAIISFILSLCLIRLVIERK